LLNCFESRSKLNASMGAVEPRTTGWMMHLEGGSCSELCPKRRSAETSTK
jgi:hypothetical protein